MTGGVERGIWGERETDRIRWIERGGEEKGGRRGIAAAAALSTCWLPCPPLFLPATFISPCGQQTRTLLLCLPLPPSSPPPPPPPPGAQMLARRPRRRMPTVPWVGIPFRGGGGIPPHQSASQMGSKPTQTTRPQMRERPSLAAPAERAHDTVKPG